MLQRMPMLVAAFLSLALMSPIAGYAQANTTVVVCFPPGDVIPTTSTLEGYNGPGCVAGSTASFSVVTPAAQPTGGAAAASRTVSSFEFTKAVDAASPAAFIAAASGTRLPSADVHFLSTGAEMTEVSTLVLNDVLIAGFKQESLTDTALSDVVTLSYGRVCMTVGGNEQCFDVTANTAG